MDKFILIFALVSVNYFALAQDEEKRNLYYGNAYFDEEKYDDAILYYQEAIAVSPLSFKPHFNMAGAYFRKQDFEKAASIYESIADLAPTAYDRSRLYHNLGNSYLSGQKVDDAIEAYKSALRLNPLDEETRYNLAYALQLKKEQDKQKQDQNKNEDQNKEDQSEENQNEEKKNEGDENNNDPDTEDQENENGNESDKNEGDKNEGEQKAEPNKISKEQAKRILEAAYKREKEIQKLLEKTKKVGEGTSSKKDW